MDSILVDSRRCPSILVVMRDIHGITGRGSATTTFLSVLPVELVAKAHTDRETFEPTLRARQTGADHPSSGGGPCGLGALILTGRAPMSSGPSCSLDPSVAKEEDRDAA